MDDFPVVPYTLTFPASTMMGVQCADIIIDTDALYEGPEQFLVTFTDAMPGGANVGAISQTCVVIVDGELYTVPALYNTRDSHQYCCWCSRLAL